MKYLAGLVFLFMSVLSPLSAQSLDSEQLAFLTLINNYRSQNGAGPLQVSATLQAASQWMSQDLAANGYFSHTDSLGRDPFTRMSAFGYSYNTYKGENIAGGNSTAQATFTQWQNSDGHRANMLDPTFTVIGIGRAYNSAAPYGWYWTTDFGGYADQTISTSGGGMGAGVGSVMLTPTPRTALAGTAVTFTWTAGTGVSGRELWVGTTVGSWNVAYAPGLGTATSYNATLVGTGPGAPVYVRLWSLIGSTWSFNDYTYTAPAATAVSSTMITPAPGATLSGTSVTLTWTPGTGVSGHELWIGTTPGGRNVAYAPALGTATSYNATLVNTTPAATLYVRLWSLIGSTWASNDYTYIAPAGTGAASTIITPTPGTTLSGTTVSFTWTAGSGVSGHELWIGTNPGARNVTYAPGLGAATSYNATLLGTSPGATLYVKLWSLIGSTWTSTDYTYTAPSGSTAISTMISPTPGTTLSGATVMFAWTAGGGVSGHELWIGTTPGSWNATYAPSLGTATSYTATLVGTTPGATVYVRLWSLIGATWASSDYTYTAR